MKNIIKTTISVLLILSTLLLSGCKSSDYKKANKLFESGEYFQAIEIYEELGEYEDSQEKIADCKFSMLVEYIRNYGIDYETYKCIKYTEDSKDFYLGVVNDNALIVFYDYESSGLGFTIEAKMNFLINRNNNISKYDASFITVIATNSQNAYNSQTGSGTIDISLMNKDYVVKIDDFSENIKDIYGKTTNSTVDKDNSFSETLSNWSDLILDALPKILGGINIDITMKDLGFKNY